MANKTDRIALIGFMGAGKTSVARALTQLSGMKFIDMDTEIEKMAQMTISEIFAKYGEAHFRQLEHQFCRQIPHMGNVIIATGGGCVVDDRNRAIIKENALVVYLKALPEIIYGRIKDDASRPLLFGEDKLVTIRAMIAEREPLYVQAMDFVVDTDGIDVAECGLAVWNALKSIPIIVHNPFYQTQVPFQCE